MKFFIVFNSFREKDIFRNILQLNFMYILDKTKLTYFQTN